MIASPFLLWSVLCQLCASFYNETVVRVVNFYFGYGALCAW